MGGPPWVVCLGWGEERRPSAWGATLELNHAQGGGGWWGGGRGRTFLAQGTACVQREGHGIVER